MFIDGIKIEVSSTDGCKWLDLPMLQFRSIVNEVTGEVLGNSKIAIYKGLRFTITQSNKELNKYYYSVRGSLAKYWNKGENNALDFDFLTFQKVVKDLEQTFFINPYTSTIHALEFGVNIETKQEPKKVLNSLISNKNDIFYNLKIAGQSVGKQQPKQRYSLKIYDKGKQSKTDSNLMRFEISVKKMHYLKDFDIVTLSDLLDNDKIKPLGGLLLSEWANTLLYDYGMQWRKMSPFEKQKFLYYIRPAHWLQFSRKQRFRAKKHFAELIETYGTSPTHKNISTSIAEKWQELTAVKCPRLNPDFKKLQPFQMSTFEPLKCTVQKYPFNTLTNITKEQTKTLPKKALIIKHKNRACLNCKKDISNKRISTKYCSKRCNNKTNGMKRTAKRQKAREIENINLLKLKKNLKPNRLTLEISYKYEGISYTDNLLQNEINAPPDWIKRVFKIVVRGYRQNQNPIELTSFRARKLIKTISLTKNKKGC